MMRSALVVVALFACGKDREVGTGTVVQPSVFADVLLNLPDGWSATYDKATDAQVITGKGTTVRLDRADERYVASPDAFMNHLSPRWKGRLVTIEDRLNVRNSGFAMNLGIYKDEKDEHPLHVTVVTGKLGKVWYRCIGEGIDDEALRQEVIQLCQSVHP
jgi:hypothetical protein